MTMSPDSVVKNSNVFKNKPIGMVIVLYFESG